MTYSTGKRSSRACVRCRTRKTRCDLTRVGLPNKPPCLSCHETESECVLVQSRRGGNFRIPRRSNPPRPDTVPPDNPAQVDHTADTAADGSNVGCCRARVSSTTNEGALAGQELDHVLAMDLQNPSDALQILAQSGRKYSRDNRRDNASSRHSTHEADSSIRERRPSIDENTTSTDHRRPGIAAFDSFELVQRKILSTELVFELLHTSVALYHASIGEMDKLMAYRYSKVYHPFCPVVPGRLLRQPQAIDWQKDDHFLLTCILTIASRDDSCQSLTHRYCWDHAQRLLVDVLLAYNWTQSPRIVEGILLLAEWLPHIQDEPTEKSKSLFGGEATAWSLVGLAVRHGYLQRLDSAAFRGLRDDSSQERAEQNRIIWSSDRQMSVRLGQSFWSRGPSLGSNFTADDFPSLKPQPDNEGSVEDYASVLQATMELTQILHNAHSILYPSKERTLAMIHEGNYARYLDDFQKASSSWHSTWSRIAAPENIKSTIFIMYEYVCLYTNAFSFQAVSVRGLSPQRSGQRHGKENKSFATLFSNGIMQSPDGLYISNTINAAIKLLKLMNELNPQAVIRYLPSRYYIYGVYAAVLLHRAECAGAFDTGAWREVPHLAHTFISVLEKAPSTESHICNNYARMLRRMWQSYRPHQPNPHVLQSSDNGSVTYTVMENHPHAYHTNDPASTDRLANFSMSSFDSPSSLENELSTIFPTGDYLFGSFMPGLAGFKDFNFDESFGQQIAYDGNFQD
ncbi:unnamed protein product [Penicillium olsonii]|uniref:Zn(2)-C6 fungal-type domain-containing protein n=1 Tax=Penicillium olsonii TaxID=99116 RepID=A0A9W4N782_PENOL|nr:unnamed protein product [Penicillium olsonii]CAG8278233.1 unnamed protein product [Penicillium olsonii]